MDPLTALGLSCNIIQCIHFAGKIISQTQQIYNATDEAPGDVTSLKQLATNLSIVSQDVGRESQTFRNQEKLSLVERQLHELCKESESVNKQIVSRIKELEFKGSRTRWNSFRHTVASVWSQRDVRAMESTLDRIRKELDTTLLVCLRYHIATLLSPLLLTLFQRTARKTDGLE